MEITLSYGIGVNMKGSTRGYFEKCLHMEDGWCLECVAKEFEKLVNELDAANQKFVELATELDGTTRKLEFATGLIQDAKGNGLEL